MNKKCSSVGFAVLLWTVRLAAQQQERPGSIAAPIIVPSSGIKIPDLSVVKEKQLQAGKPQTHPRGDFLKNLTIDSFGYSSKEIAEGFEFAPNLSSGPSTAHGLECPRCVVRPPLERSRVTLLPFGAQATLKTVTDQFEVFVGFGGVNGWRVDNTGIEPGILSFRRDSSFNDAWLQQSWVGARFAADHGRHLWFSTRDDKVKNFGSYGLKRWNVVSGGATFEWGQ
jgi:hypothetical protein